jgi:hypothetical protein
MVIAGALLLHKFIQQFGMVLVKSRKNPTDTFWLPNKLMGADKLNKPETFCQGYQQSPMKFDMAHKAAMCDRSQIVM